MESKEERERMELHPSGREAPLPPVTTRWEGPGVSAKSGQSEILVPPFVPAGMPQEPAQPMPVLRTFDSRPTDAAESAPPMPWENAADSSAATSAPPASHEITGSAAQILTSDSGMTKATDLDAWDSGIVDVDGGQAVPAYGDEETAEDAAFSPPPQLDDEGAVVKENDRDDEQFPLDAFIIPPDAKRLPKGLEHAEELHLEVAEALARRLEDVAQRLRREGFAGLLHHEPGQEPIDTLIAGVLAGYLSHHADS